MLKITNLNLQVLKASKKVNIAIIPARAGSKRIKNKNIKLFNKRPIIYWSILAAIQSKLFSRIIVSTDSLKIAKISKKLGAEVPFLRSKKLSGDKAGIDKVVIETLKRLNITNKKNLYICCILAASPFIESENLRKASRIIKKKYINYVFPAIKLSSKILRAFIKNRSGEINMVSKKYYKINSQNLRKVYLDAGQFYFGKYTSWIKKKNIYFNNSRIIEISEKKNVDIDTPEDWKRANKILKLNER